jgi:hypothetical protein
MQSVHGTLAASTQTNEVQEVEITGTPNGGDFTLTFDGQTTGDIAFDADAAAVDAALEALSNIPAGGVTVGGGPLPGTPVEVTFTGALAGAPQPEMTATSSLTGGTDPDVTVTTTTPGTGASVATVDLGQDANEVRVVNRNGTAEIYFRVDGLDPIIGGDDTFVLPAQIGSLTVQTRGTSNVVVKLASTGAATFSVMADI